MILECRFVCTYIILEIRNVRVINYTFLFTYFLCFISFASYNYWRYCHVHINIILQTATAGNIYLCLILCVKSIWFLVWVIGNGLCKFCVDNAFKASIFISHIYHFKEKISIYPIFYWLDKQRSLQVLDLENCFFHTLNILLLSLVEVGLGYGYFNFEGLVCTWIFNCLLILLSVAKVL